MGDLVLVAFAERLGSVLRASDTAARLGGDEFAIVCEDTAFADAEVLASRLRTAVTAPLLIGETPVPLGVSIGIGCVPGGDEPGTLYERVVRAADDAMYADKATRRSH
jgi:diguanylate cyclase (GGDEF)-like protein